MNRNIAQALVVVVVVAGLLTATGGIASASGTQTYRNSMMELLPTVDAWMTEVHTMATAAATKPTDENLAEVGRLAVTGTYILDDLRGTAQDMPEPLRAAHWSLADSLGTIIGDAQAFSENPAESSARMCAELENAQPAHDTIDNFLTRFGVIGAPGGATPGGF